MDARLVSRPLTSLLSPPPPPMTCSRPRSCFSSREAWSPRARCPHSSLLTPHSSLLIIQLLAAKKLGPRGPAVIQMLRLGLGSAADTDLTGGLVEVAKQLGRAGLKVRELGPAAGTNLAGGLVFEVAKQLDSAEKMPPLQDPDLETSL